ncbi:MAG: PQQ-binding-like beta-propeller repeat protein, partial [Phaeodactylibacter sp.]|nr:PQQ-binding-like beta-propeller repeat protein [Phaeodactylibacter sp.]
RGAGFDNISRSPIQLIDKFGPSGPKVMWTKELGEGHAGAAIYQGEVYVLDYDEEARADVLRCFDLKTGKELWRRWHHINLKRNHGLSRTIPAVTEKYILAIGPAGHTMCMSRASGDLLWGLDISREYGSEIPFWYTGQCPLIDGEEAIIATGGKALLIGVDCASGEVLWETPNDKGWKMSHASVMPFEFEGVKMYVYSAVGGVAGIAAEGPEKGKVLWESSEWNHPVVAPSPVCLPDGKIFLSAGYGAGSMLLQLEKTGAGFQVEILAEYAPKDGLSSEQQTPIYYGGYLYGILPKDAGALRNELVCVHPDNVQQVVWSSGKANRFGLGPYMIADDKLYILDDHATLTIARPGKTKYEQLDQVQLFEGFDAWAPFALADGFMILRDSKRMMCIDLKE